MKGVPIRLEAPCKVLGLGFRVLGLGLLLRNSLLSYHSRSCSLNSLKGGYIGGYIGE